MPRNRRPWRYFATTSQKWVNASTLTFTGTIVEMGASNVSGIDSKDFPMIVRVKEVESGDDQALKKFGSLKDTELTVIVGSLDKKWPKK